MQQYMNSISRPGALPMGSYCFASVR